MKKKDPSWFGTSMVPPSHGQFTSCQLFPEYTHATAANQPVIPELDGHDLELGQAHATATARPAGLEEEQAEAREAAARQLRRVTDRLVPPRERIARDEGRVEATVTHCAAFLQEEE